jgi:hypothetical protein
MASPEAKIRERLHEIAARVHWRHVMRIAASKVFAFPELRHLRQVVIHVCDALDHDLTLADIAVRSGARLALDLLEDNVAARLPDARCSLTARALSLLELGPPQFDSRLTSLLDLETIETVQREVTMRISQGMTTPALGAWKMLFALARHDYLHESWGVSQIKTWWPSSAEQSLALIEAMGELPNLAQPVIEAIRNAQAIAGFKATANTVEASEALNNTSNSLQLNLIPVDLLSEQGDPYYIFVGSESDLVDKIIQMIPSAFEDFREVSRCCEGTKRQICTTSWDLVALFPNSCVSWEWQTHSAARSPKRDAAISAPES